MLRRNDNNIALFRDNSVAGAVANDCRTDIRDINLCALCNDPSNDNRIILQKVLNKKNNTDLSFYKRKTFYTDVANASNFLFDIGVESGFEITHNIIVTFGNKNFHDQTYDASMFD